MNAAALIYLASVSGNLSIFFTLTAVAVGAIGLFLAIVLSDDPNQAKRFLKFLVPAFVAISLIAVLLPNEKTIYLMAGAKVSQDILTSPETKEIGGKILKILNQKLDEQMEAKK